MKQENLKITESSEQCNCCGAQNINGSYDHDTECIYYECTTTTNSESPLWVLGAVYRKEDNI